MKESILDSRFHGNDKKETIPDSRFHGNDKKETLKQKKNRATGIVAILADEYALDKIGLVYYSPFELLVSTILSAQCTDDRVNQVTAKLFRKYNKPEDFAAIANEELEELIFSTGYYKAKTKHIKAAAIYLIEKHRGEVPGNMEELLQIPGVGRKTANVLLGHLFGVPGIVVDTHVLRITNRLGLVETTNATKIEFELMKLIDKNHWVMFTHYLINHGRKVCTARKPKCDKCIIREKCNRII